MLNEQKIILTGNVVLLQIAKEIIACKKTSTDKESWKAKERANEKQEEGEEEEQEKEK